MKKNIKKEKRINIISIISLFLLSTGFNTPYITKYYENFKNIFFFNHILARIFMISVIILIIYCCFRAGENAAFACTGILFLIASSIIIRYVKREGKIINEFLYNKNQPGRETVKENKDAEIIDNNNSEYNFKTLLESRQIYFKYIKNKI